VDCFDEVRPNSRCLLGTAACDPRHPCRAHHRWTAVQQARRAALADTTVADLLAGLAADGTRDTATTTARSALPSHDAAFAAD
jgi:DNA-binding IscR family transcriptional regulator